MQLKREPMPFVQAEVSPNKTETGLVGGIDLNSKMHEMALERARKLGTLKRAPNGRVICPICGDPECPYNRDV